MQGTKENILMASLELFHKEDFQQFLSEIFVKK